MVNGRAKGGAAERELADLLMGWSILAGRPIKPSRNLEQSRNGGFDLNGVPGLAVECKRVEVLAVSAWWRQAVRQADNAKLIPFLAYRTNRSPWRFRVRAYLYPCPTPIDVDLEVEPARAWFTAHLKNFGESPK